MSGKLCNSDKILCLLSKDGNKVYEKLPWNSQDGHNLYDRFTGYDFQIWEVQGRHSRRPLTKCNQTDGS